MRMNTELFSNVNAAQAAMIEGLYSAAKENSSQTQRAWINQFSPYSQEINRHIMTCGELQAYTNLTLQEARVTRLSLVRDIDPDLWISVKGKTNLQLMREGHSPYVFDDPTGVIELHHVGQHYNAPFAELTKAEHVMHGNSRVYHTSEESSWRNDKNLVKQFHAEETEYWKQRAHGNIVMLAEKPITPIQSPVSIVQPSHLPITIKEQIEFFLSECSIQDLCYIENLAGNLIMTRESGISSFSELISPDTSEDADVSNATCTFCGSLENTAYGYQMHAGEKVQRYQCKCCGKVFTVINRSIIYGCRFSFTDWQRFLNCLANGISEEETARLCGISKTTVHEYRLRVFYALCLLDQEVQLQGNVVIDETYVAKSYKGNRSLQADFVLGRKPRERGSEIHTPGLSDEQVCIETALDEYGNSVARIAGLGAPSAGRITYAMADAITKENVSLIFSDKEIALFKYAKTIEVPIRQAKLPDEKTKKIPKGYYSKENQEAIRQLQRINSYHSRLKKFLSRFAGVSSRLLLGYVCLFAWKDRYRHDMEEGYRALFSILLRPNLYKTAEEISALPFFQDPTNKVPRTAHTHIRDQERSRTIYARYMAGERVVDIAKDYGVSRAWIYFIVGECSKGAAGTQVRQRKREDEKEQQEKLKNIKYPHHYERYAQRNAEIYNKRMNWHGTLEDFCDTMAEEYGLAKQTIQNIVSTQKRINALREPFYIHETFTYKTLPEVYAAVNDRFLELSARGMIEKECIGIIAKEFGYKEASVKKIIDTMRTEIPESLTARIKRLSKDETLQRDRAVFVDYLRWQGTRKAFCLWAHEKYGMVPSYVNQILTYCCYADYNRYEISWRSPTPRSESGADL